MLLKEIVPAPQGYSCLEASTAGKGVANLPTVGDTVLARSLRQVYN